jgi:hypothetical protein
MRAARSCSSPWKTTAERRYGAARQGGVQDWLAGPVQLRICAWVPGVAGQFAGRYEIGMKPACHGG